MRLNPFKLERYFAEYEFSAQYLLSSSDCDGLLLADLMALADDETRSLWDNLALGYTESPGHPLLRQEIAQLYAGVAPEDCLVVAPQEGILLAMTAILQPGDHVVCTFPGYQSLYEVAQGLGCEVTRWEPDERQGWRFDPAALEMHLRPTTRLVVANFPHNPTGYLPDVGDFDRMLDIVRRRDAYFFSDEMYRLLEHNPTARLPAACQLYDKAITLSGMSKVFGLAGLRIGWLITRDRALAARLAELKDYTTICSSAPSEILSLIALRARDAIIERHRARIRRNLALLDAFFVEHASWMEWVRPRAGTVGFPRLRITEDAETFCRRAVAEAGVMLLPSTVYDYGDRHIRLGFGRENLPAALEKLSEYLERL